jgi:hypothetical protein
MARRARAQQESEPQDAPQDGPQDEPMEDAGDELTGFNGDGTTYIDDLRNELLNEVTSLAIAAGAPIETLRLDSKRFRACAQSHFVEKFQEKVRMVYRRRKPKVNKRLGKPQLHQIH